VFRTISRLLLPNPLDRRLKKLQVKQGKKVLLTWNRGLGDIALGLYAIIHRIREFIPDAEITFLTRKNLIDGFSLLTSVNTLIAPDWKRGEPIFLNQTLKQLNIDPKTFDLIIEAPSPTDWVSWQRGKLTPRLKWNPIYDALWKSFDLPDGFTYIAVQVVAETNYGLWRNFPLSKWEELFSRLEAMKNVKVLLFGFGNEPLFTHSNIIDLRGKTTLFELLSIIKNKCKAAILPDSGILSMIYYLDTEFPVQLISLWADPNHGILKQAVASPNSQLTHHPLIGSFRDLSTVSTASIMNILFPLKPLFICSEISNSSKSFSHLSGAIILAGGQGSRLGISGPKGTFQLGKKSLFQWLCDKAPKENFPLAIMTSELNHLETVAFFKKHQFFNREIYFFKQTVQPLLDEKRKPLSITGPNGNGAIFKAFTDSGLATLFAEKNIHSVTVLPVDNPLGDPFDNAFISHHIEMGNDVTLKCIKRLFPQEPMGALVEREGRIEIVEYLDLDPSLSYVYANTGIMAMSLSFLTKMAQKELPLHYVKKRAEGRDVLKGERFIFDALPYAAKVEALCFDRKVCYAPLKSTQSLDLQELKFFLS
jgi:ADP-heptose:LPS heptosyltransferase